MFEETYNFFFWIVEPHLPSKDKAPTIDPSLVNVYYIKIVENTESTKEGSSHKTHFLPENASNKNAKKIQQKPLRLTRQTTRKKQWKSEYVAQPSQVDGLKQ